jgi:diadenosine tetraphosphatase ApaH/serine/threonine PP2A family protein phosphatase
MGIRDWTGMRELSAHLLVEWTGADVAAWDVAQPVVVCGHSHVPRVVALSDGRLVVNPGSVGIPAYTDDLPYPHVMEAGSPHARYALLRKEAAGWTVELVGVPYAWDEAARVARSNGRDDRAIRIATGRAVLDVAS